MKKNIYLLLILFFLSVSTVFTESAFSASTDLVKFEKAKVYFKKGIHHFNNMHYLASVEFFRKAVNSYPGYLSARDYLARAYKLAGFTGAALVEMENYRAMAPDNIVILSKINRLKYRESNPGNALDHNNIIHVKSYNYSNLRNYSFEKPVDIAVDNEKNIYITSFDSGKLTKIDINGNGLFSVRPSFDSRLYGVDCLDDRLVVSDFKNDKVYILNTKGTVLKEIGKSGSGSGQFHGPEGVVFDSKGDFFVVDSGNSRVQKFSSSGEFLLKMGTKGEYEGNLKRPSDVTISGDNLYISDTGNNRIAVFDIYGNFIKNFTIEKMSKPRGIFSYNNKLLISDENRGLLFYNELSKSENWFSSWKGGEGRFSKLISSVVDRDGFLYCVDYNSHNVQVFSNASKRYSNLELEITSVDLQKFPIVAFYINVRGVDGRAIYGLKAKNFRVTENKAKMSGLSVNYLKKKTSSVTMTLCVDRSLEMKKNHNEISWTSDFILKKMRKNDRVNVINFNKEMWQGNKFDWSRRRTLRALKKMEYSSGKRIGFTLYNAISGLIHRLNRRAVILVTDGTVADDSFSQYSSSNVIGYAKSHYIPIYIISFKKPDERLKRIAMETGGKVFTTSDFNKLNTIYSKIKKSEEYRYVLVYSTYKSLSFKGWWSDVKIGVKYNGQQGIEWGGYFVP